MTKEEYISSIIKYRKLQTIWEAERMEGGRRNLFKNGVTEFLDIHYLQDNNPRHVLDVFSPSESGKKPVIIEVHGGGYTACEKNINRLHSRYYASLGYKVINTEYSLIPEATFHDIFNELSAAVRWAEVNKDKFGFDLNHLYMSGDSAGGHLTAIYCIMQKSKEMQEFFDVAMPETEIKAAALSCPAFTFMYNKPDGEYGKELEKLRSMVFYEKPEDKFLRMLDVPFLIQVNPFPPIFMVTTPGDDLLYKEDVRLGKILTESGNGSSFRVYRNKGNNLGHVFNVLFPELPESICANRDISEFFFRY